MSKPDSTAERTRMPKAARSPLFWRVFWTNMVAVLSLCAGLLIWVDQDDGVVRLREEGVRSQAELVASVLSEVATVGLPEPELQEDEARALIRRMQLPRDLRVRIIAPDGRLIADSDLLQEVQPRALPPVYGWGFFDEVLRSVAIELGRLRDGFSTLAPPAPAPTLIEELSRAITGATDPVRRFNEVGEDVISVAVPLQHIAIVIGVVVVEADDIRDTINARRAATLPFIFGALLFGLLFSAGLAFSIARPLRTLSEGAERVRTRRSQSLELGKIGERGDEIGELARAFASMTQSLMSRVGDNTRFAADTVHEIKTPLITIRRTVQLALQTADPDERSRLVAAINAAFLRMDRIISEISAAAKTDRDMLTNTPVEFDLIALLEAVIGLCQPEPEQTSAPAHIAFRSSTGELPPHLPHSGYEEPLARAIQNIISNAVSFSPPGGLIEVILSIDAKGGPSVIEVIDEGPGIPEQALERIFERFYTDRPSEGMGATKAGRIGGNSGLGLAIARATLAQHGGTIRAENSAPRRNHDDVEEGGPSDTKSEDQTGARFIITLPRSPV